MARIKELAGPLLALLLILASPYRIVLRDGSTVQAQGPPKRSGSVALIRLQGGTLTSLPSEEIDEAATARANAPQPTPVPPAPSPRKTIEIIGSAPTGGGYVSPSSGAASAPPAAVSGSSGGPSAPSSGRVQVSGYVNSHGTYVAPYTRSAPSSGGGKKH